MKVYNAATLLKISKSGFSLCADGMPFGNYDLNSVMKERCKCNNHVQLRRLIIIFEVANSKSPAYLLPSLSLPFSKLYEGAVFESN